jgi:hypothetical protein
VVKRQVLGDAVGVGHVHAGQAAKGTAAFGIFGLRQMAPTGAGAQDFSAGRNLETFGHGLFGFDAFGTSHKILKSLSQKSANYTLPAMVVASDFYRQN